MNAQYIDKFGVGYNIHRRQDGTWEVWSWHNKATGWMWKGTFPSEGLAHSFLAMLGSF